MIIGSFLQIAKNSLFVCSSKLRSESRDRQSIYNCNACNTGSSWNRFSVSGEILLVDEVLSAGDINFQAKARKRMVDVMDSARILVLVLHDMNAIKEVCSRTILLNNGSIIADGKPDEIVQLYLNRGLCC